MVRIIRSAKYEETKILSELSSYSNLRIPKKRKEETSGKK